MMDAHANNDGDQMLDPANPDVIPWMEDDLHAKQEHDNLR